MRYFFIGALLLVFPPSAYPALAQEAPEYQAPIELGSPAASVLGGLAVGTAGFFAGGFTGVALSAGCDEELCVLGPALLGALVGANLGMAIGVHAGNRGRGDFGAVFGAGAAFTALGLLGGAWTLQSGEAATVALVAGNLAVMIAVERATARRNLRNQRWRVGLAPDPRGGLNLGATVRF